MQKKGGGEREEGKIKGEETRRGRDERREEDPSSSIHRIIDAPWSIQQDWTGNNGGFEHRSWLHPPPRRPLRPVFFHPFLPPPVLNWIVAWKMNRLSLSIFSFSLLFLFFLPPGFRYFVVDPEPRRKGEGGGGYKKRNQAALLREDYFVACPPRAREPTDSSSLARIEIIHPRAFRFAFNVTKTYGSVYLCGWRRRVVK